MSRITSGIAASMSVDQKELAALHKNLRNLRRQFGKDKVKKLIESKSKVFVTTAQSLAPVSKAPHQGRPNGAIYHPGNLKKSPMILKTGKFKHFQSVFIGPKWIKNARGKSYGLGNTVNAYYARIVESKFMAFMGPAFNIAKPIYLGLMNNAIKGWVKKIKR